jgi:hypothetical protein
MKKFALITTLLLSLAVAPEFDVTPNETDPDLPPQHLLKDADSSRSVSPLQG